MPIDDFVSHLGESASVLITLHVTPVYRQGYVRREDLTKAAGEILRSVLIRSFSREDLIGQPNDDLLSQESGHRQPRRSRQSEQR